MDPEFVKIQLAVSDLRPLSVLIDISVTLRHLVLHVFPLFPVQIDSVGQRMPGISAQLSKARGKNIPPVILILFRHVPPHFGVEMFSPLRLLPDHGGFLYFAAGESAQRLKDLVVGMLPGLAQYHEQPVPFNILRVNITYGLLRRHPAQHRKFQDPSVQVVAHDFVPVPCVQITCLKFLHFPKAFFRRCRSDHIEQLINIHISHRCRDRIELSLSHPRSPGKKSPQLVQIQIMIGGKIAPEFIVPGRVVLIVLHKFSLAVEIPALVLKRIDPVFVELHHLKDPGRDLIASGVPDLQRPVCLCHPEKIHQSLPRCFPALLFFSLLYSALIVVAAHRFQGKERVMVGLPGFSGVRCPAFSGIRRTARFLQNNGVPTGPDLADRRIEQPEYDLRVRPVIKNNADPLAPFHAESIRQIWRIDLPQDLLPALDITSADLCPGLIIPLLHQKSDPLVCFGVGQD